VAARVADHQVQSGAERGYRAPVATPEWLQAARDRWTNRGQQRPPFAEEPGPGQESVWDYPRPPAVVPDARPVEVRDGGGRLVARAERTVRVLETSQPPAFYLPPASVVEGALVAVPGSSHCEWKGQAEYLALAGTATPVGWRYPAPYEEFAALAGWVAFYPDRVACTVAGERVRPQPGGFYGGWITDDVVGPFKGGPGSSDW
jgi:uncharacterized protein (DUF427 family)